MNTIIMQSLTFIILILVSKKIATLKFLPHTDNWSDTDHYIDSQFHASEKRKVTNDIPETYQYSE